MADHGIAFVSLITDGHKVIGLLPKAAVDLSLIHETHHVDGVLCFELEFIKFFGVDQNVMPFGVLIALDDFLIGHFDKFISVPNAFDITDGFSARLWIMRNETASSVETAGQSLTG